MAARENMRDFSFRKKSAIKVALSVIADIKELRVLLRAGATSAIDQKLLHIIVSLMRLLQGGGRGRCP